VAFARAIVSVLYAVRHPQHMLIMDIVWPVTALSAYVKAMEHGSELRDNENAVACFYRILRNAIADHYRRGGACARAHERFAAEAPISFKPELEQTSCACIKDVMRDSRLNIARRSNEWIW
jgi:DNA-directed RNA polymerase specialized sigma24 family protein